MYETHSANKGNLRQSDLKKEVYEHPRYFKSAGFLVEAAVDATINVGEGGWGVSGRAFRRGGFRCDGYEN